MGLRRYLQWTFYEADSKAVIVPLLNYFVRVTITEGVNSRS